MLVNHRIFALILLSRLNESNKQYTESCDVVIKISKARDFRVKKLQHINLGQLCPTQMARWVKNFVTILTRAAHGMTC